jgi:hypothetical protein
MVRLINATMHYTESKSVEVHYVVNGPFGIVANNGCDDTRLFQTVSAHDHVKKNPE